MRAGAHGYAVAALRGALAACFLILLTPGKAGAQVTVWAAVPGNPVNLPDEAYKYLDADEACRGEFTLPPDDVCSKNNRNLHNFGGPQTTGGCLFENTCTCAFCGTGSFPTGGNTQLQPTRMSTFGKTRTCADGKPPYLGRCDLDPAKTKGCGKAASSGGTPGDAGSNPIVGDAGLGPFVGNPCNAVTGNKVQAETIYASPSGRLDLVLAYNSQAGTGSFRKGAFGTGWSARHFARLRDSSQGVIAVERPSGREIEFRAPPSGNVYVADADIEDRLERIADASGNFVEWRLTTSAGDEQLTYDAAGHLLRIRNRAQLAETLSYSTIDTPHSIAPEAGYLVSVSDPFGRRLDYSYDVNRRVSTMTDPAQGVYRFEYDGPSGPANANNLTRITLPDGHNRTYFYGEAAQINGGAACSPPSPVLANALTGIQDENGARFATWTYDCQGRVTSSAHAGGADLYTISYNANSRVIVDALGTSRTLSLADQRILGVAYSAGTTQPSAVGDGNTSNALGYDGNGNVASRTDFNGNLTTYVYDLSRNLETSRTEASGTPQARTISTRWHPDFRLRAKVAEPLRVTTYVYNGDGGAQCGFKADGATPVPGVLCSKTVQPTSDATGSAGFAAAPAGTPRIWAFTYDANGAVLTADGPRTDASDVTSYAYYAIDDPDLGKRGNLASITNALGHVTSVTAYNAHGQPLTIVDPNGLITTLAYDSRQRLASRNVGGEVTSYAYDGAGQLTQVTLPDGSNLAYAYDGAHRLTGISDNLGNRVSYALDPRGNRILEQVFDPENALARTRSRAFNNLNRLAQELGAQNQTTRYGYDDQGNVVSVFDPLDHATASQYDALNRLVRVTDPNQGLTRYSYDGVNQLVSVTDPRNLATSYSYDGLSNLNSQLSPDTGTTSNSYDAAGNLLTRIDAKGQQTIFAYDALNRVTSVAFADGSRQDYVYDLNENGIGRLTHITELDSNQQVTSVISYAYDLHGRTTAETRTISGVPYTLAYSYDPFGRLSGMSYPSGRVISYLFDGLGRINQVSTVPPGETEAQIVASGIAYQPFGGVRSFTFGNGEVYTRGFDLDGRVSSYSLGNKSFAIGYDLASRIGFIADTNDPTSANTYSYDNLDRLTGAVLPGVPFAYTYDAVGNRVSRTVGAATERYAYDTSSNRLQNVTAQTGAVRSFAFDPNGSTVDDGVNRYAYDTRGRMAQSTGALGATTYQVNALGQRVRKTNAGDDRVFLYDNRGRLIAETDPGGGVKREYLYLNDIPLAVVQ